MAITRNDWKNQILQHHKLTENSEDFKVINQNLDILFDKVSAKVKLSHLQSSGTLVTQMVSTAVTVSAACFLTARFLLPAVSVPASILYGLVRFGASAGSITLVRKLIADSWNESEVISTKLMEQTTRRLLSVEAGKLAEQVNTINASLPDATSLNKHNFVAGLAAGVMEGSSIFSIGSGSSMGVFAANFFPSDLGKRVYNDVVENISSTIFGRARQ